MTVGKRIFRKVHRSDADRFCATYKGHEIEINRIDHTSLYWRHDKPQFDVTVFGPGGGFAVDTLFDGTDIKAAIEYACNGACI